MLLRMSVSVRGPSYHMTMMLFVPQYGVQSAIRMCLHTSTHRQTHLLTLSQNHVVLCRHLSLYRKGEIHVFGFKKNLIYLFIFLTSHLSSFKPQIKQFGCLGFV